MYTMKILKILTQNYQSVIWIYTNLHNFTLKQRQPYRIYNWRTIYLIDHILLYMIMCLKKYSKHTLLSWVFFLSILNALHTHTAIFSDFGWLNLYSGGSWVELGWELHDFNRLHVQVRRLSCRSLTGATRPMKHSLCRNRWKYLCELTMCAGSLNNEGLYTCSTGYDRYLWGCTAPAKSAAGCWLWQEGCLSLKQGDHKNK